MNILVVIVGLVVVAVLLDRALRAPTRTTDTPLVADEREGTLDKEIEGLVQRGYVVQSRSPDAAQLIRPKVFSFVWAFLWLLVFGIGVLVYIIYYAGKQDESVYLTIDEYGRVSRTVPNWWG